jgi:hypothetical protein
MAGGEAEIVVFERLESRPENVAALPNGPLWAARPVSRLAMPGMPRLSRPYPHRFVEAGREFSSQRPASVRCRAEFIVVQKFVARLALRLC